MDIRTSGPEQDGGGPEQLLPSDLGGETEHRPAHYVRCLVCRPTSLLSQPDRPT